MSETEEKEPRTKLNGKLKLGIAFLSITIGCLIARPFWTEQQNAQHNEQYAYLDSIKIINPVEYAQKLYDEGHYKDAQDYIAFYQNLPLVSSEEAEKLNPILDKVLETRASLEYKLKEAGKGFFLGKSEESYGKAAEFVSEFSGVGDVRDLVTAGYSYANDKEVDLFTAGLAGAGLILTVASVGPQASATIPAKTGVAVLKIAKKINKISEPMQKSIKNVIAKVAKERKKEVAFKEFVEPMAQLGQYHKRTNLTNTIEVIGKSDSISDIPKTIKVADQFGIQAANVFRYSGPDVLTVTEKVGAEAVLKASKYGPEAVSALKTVPVDKLINSIRALGKIVAKPFINMIDMIFYIVSAICGIIGSILGFYGLRSLIKIVKPS